MLHTHHPGPDYIEAELWLVQGKKVLVILTEVLKNWIACEIPTLDLFIFVTHVHPSSVKDPIPRITR